MGCVFCDIIEGNHPQSKLIIHKDELCTAFLDHVQQHPGHVLIVPNKHIRNIFALNQDLAAHLFKVTTLMAKKVKKTFRHEGVDIYQCNEKCAGQSVFHLHIHVFPRTKGDNLFRIYANQQPNMLEIDDIVKIKDELLKN